MSYNTNKLLSLSQYYYLLATAQDWSELLKSQASTLYYQMKAFADSVKANSVDIHIDPKDSKFVLETKISSEADSQKFYFKFAKELALALKAKVDQEVWITINF